MPGVDCLVRGDGFYPLDAEDLLNWLGDFANTPMDVFAGFFNWAVGPILVGAVVGVPLWLTDKFPLVVIWTPVRQGGRSFHLTADLGITIRLKKRKRAAVRIAPTAYIP